MGGAEGGALASQLTVEHLLASSPEDGWITALSLVNSSVRRECKSAGFEAAGSTLVGVVVEEHRCVTLAVGDSRIYRIRDGELQQLTVDHNLGNLRQEEGLDPTVGDARGKPRALTSYIGNPDRAQRLDVGTVSGSTVIAYCSLPMVFTNLCRATSSPISPRREPVRALQMRSLRLPTKRAAETTRLRSLSSCLATSRSALLK